MNIICLNTWGGRAGKEQLLKFFEEHSEQIDIFCLQEVWAGRYDQLEGRLAGGKPISNDHIMTHAFQEISAVLPEHIAHFRPSFLEHYGLCMFIRKGITVLEEGDIFVHEERGFIPPEDEVGLHARNLQYATIEHHGGQITLMNFHGLWNGKGKSDCTERLQQSDRVVHFLQSREEPVVLMGDFNLLPDTMSLRKIEDAGMRNLISEYGITSTRTPLYDKQIGYADYAFVSDGVEVSEFKVLPDIVSDHAPLFLSIR
jgi:exonuclease III